LHSILIKGDLIVPVYKRNASSVLSVALGIAKLKIELFHKKKKEKDCKPTGHGTSRSFTYYQVQLRWLYDLSNICGTNLEEEKWAKTSEEAGQPTRRRSARHRNKCLKYVIYKTHTGGIIKIKINVLLIFRHKHTS